MRELSRLSAPVLRLLEYAQDWQCPSSAGSALGCLREFVRRAADEGLLSEEAVHVVGELAMPGFKVQKQIGGWRVHVI